MELLFFGLGILGFGLGIGLVVILLQIMAIIDILKSRFKSDSDKLIWILIVLFLNVIGAIIYFAIGNNQKIRS